jgi:hypothetical protein
LATINQPNIVGVANGSAAAPGGVGKYRAPVSAARLWRVNISSATTVYCVGFANFSTSTATANVLMTFRRVN